MREDNVVAADFITPRRIIESHRRVQKVCSKPTEPAITKSRINLPIEDQFKIETRFLKRLTILLFIVDERVMNTPTDKKFELSVVFLFRCTICKVTVYIIGAFNQTISRAVSDGR
jgi:hypothetical protein